MNEGLEQKNNLHETSQWAARNQTQESLIFFHPILKQEELLEQQSFPGMCFNQKMFITKEESLKDTYLAGFKHSLLF